MQQSVEQQPYDLRDMIEGDKNHLWHHLKSHACFDTREQMIIVAADGLVVEDIRGRKYLDATAGGVWSVLAGYGRDTIADAVCAQMKKMPYFAGVYGTVPAIRFAGKLLEKMPKMGKVFFSNSGSEANEKAFKMVRQAAHIIPERKGKYKILYRNRDYHGTTMGAMSASGQDLRKKDFGPFMEGFVEFAHCACYRCPYDARYPACGIACAKKVEDIIQNLGPDTVGAMIVEPITAGGGILVPVPEYFPMLQQICRKYDIWLIMDEVVCGFGRTGKFWGHDHFDVDPDIVTLAKGLTSSYGALSATVVKQHIYDLFLNDPSDPDTRFNYFRDISTYGGCTSGLTAAMENLRIIESENLVENSRVMGAYLCEQLSALERYDCVGEVRGQGLFCGVELVQDKTARTPVTEEQMADLVGKVLARGVIAGRTNASLEGLNNTLYFAPALIITKAQIDTIVQAVVQAIETTF